MALRHRRVTSYSNLRQVNGLAPIQYEGFFNHPHTVRSLCCVGGIRPRKVHSIRRLNRKAQKLGFHDWATYMQVMTAQQNLLANLQAIGSPVQPVRHA